MKGNGKERRKSPKGEEKSKEMRSEIGILIGIAVPFLRDRTAILIGMTLRFL